MKIGRLIGEATNDCEGEDGCPNFNWEDVTAEMTAIMKKRVSTMWNASVKNFGWRKLSGAKSSFMASTGANILIGVLPNTSCSFKVYRYGRYGFAINNAHHDSPTWDEWYYIRPAR